MCVWRTVAEHTSLLASRLFYLQIFIDGKQLSYLFAAACDDGGDAGVIPLNVHPLTRARVCVFTVHTFDINKDNSLVVFRARIRQ